jgi:hypothetical protein
MVQWWPVYFHSQYTFWDYFEDVGGLSDVFNAVLHCIFNSIPLTSVNYECALCMKNIRTSTYDNLM